MSFSSGTRSTMSLPFDPARPEGRHARERGRLALGEKGPDEALKGLRERGIGDVPLVLIELADANRPRANERLVQSLTTEDLPIPA